MSEIKRPAPEMLMSQQGGGGGHRKAPLHGGQGPCSTSLPGVPTRADLLIQRLRFSRSPGGPVHTGI